MSDELFREGMAASLDMDDIEQALIGPFGQRKRALMRLMAGSWKRGWDECFEEVLSVLARYEMAHLVDDVKAKVH